MSWVLSQEGASNVFSGPQKKEKIQPFGRMEILKSQQSLKTVVRVGYWIDFYYGLSEWGRLVRVYVSGQFL